ncbi:uncharacterized protein LOC134824014 isoform X10 [Bolinopsis microptera]|uniref:uncharacterized protein LOC134824014 isoform X10 n=1 Tax=Bolinopsis microptera TaxID=2820187 RepID=UPI0030796B1C
MPPKMGGRGGAGMKGGAKGGKMGAGGKMGGKMGANKMGSKAGGAGGRMGSKPGGAPKSGGSKPGFSGSGGGMKPGGGGMKPGGGGMKPGGGGMKPGGAPGAPGGMHGGSLGGHGPGGGGAGRLCVPGNKTGAAAGQQFGGRSPIPLRAHGQMQQGGAGLIPQYQASKQQLRSQNMDTAGALKPANAVLMPADNFSSGSKAQPQVAIGGSRGKEGDSKMKSIFGKDKKGENSKTKDGKKGKDAKKPDLKKGRDMMLIKGKKSKGYSSGNQGGKADNDNDEKKKSGWSVGDMVKGAVAGSLLTGMKHKKEGKMEATEDDVHRELTMRDLEKMKFQDFRDLERLKVGELARIQNTVGGAALTSNTPTALSSHMDPRLLQAASGIQGAGLMGAQMSQMSGADSDIPMDGEQTPNSADPTRFDAGVLATHPEQIGEGGQEGEMYDEERIPSDPIRVKLIDAPADQVDGKPVAQQPAHPPTLLLPPQASSAPPPEDLSSVPPSPGPMSPAMAPQLSVHPQQVPQLGGPPPQDPQFGGPPSQQMSAPAYSYESYDSSPYGETASPCGENLYNQQPGYDPLQEQYHMNAPLIDQGNPEHMFYQQQFPNNYPQNHKSYYHMQNPERYNFTKAVQNYDREAQNDGMYCYSCVMFFGVLMIGVGIIMIIVELFDLFGRHKNMPLAIAGGGTLALGIIILASAMLLWRRRRSNIKKKAAHV